MINLDNITAGSGRKVLWQCDKNPNHQWITTILSRTNGQGCPYCANKKACKDNCLATLNPKLAEEWHPTNNGSLTPFDVTKFSHKKVWWKCNKVHEWKARVSERSSGNNCPYCANKKVCIDNCLATIRPDLIPQWDFSRNSITPYDVVSKSNKKIFWICHKNHKWIATISGRTIGHGCPYCANNKVCIDNCLATLNPKLAEQWHPINNGILTPYNIIYGANKIVWWICKKGHEWHATLHKRTRGDGCPYCAGQKASKDNCLDTFHPELTKEWHPTKNGNLTPFNVTKSSGRKIWWICKNNHEWCTCVNVRSVNKNGCPYCSNHSSIRNKKQ